MQHLSRACRGWKWNWTWRCVTLVPKCVSNTCREHWSCTFAVRLIWGCLNSVILQSAWSLFFNDKNRVCCLCESAACWRVGGPSGALQIRHRLQQEGLEVEFSSSIRALTIMSTWLEYFSYFAFLPHPINPSHEDHETWAWAENGQPTTQDCRVYHHFSNRILSFGSPRSMRVCEKASIMGGGPHR